MPALDKPEIRLYKVQARVMAQACQCQAKCMQSSHKHPEA